MEEKDFKYIRCPNCGKYFIDTEIEDKMFCSHECRNFYKACIACGNYFTTSRTEDKLYCSEICGTNPEPQAHPMAPDPEFQEIVLESQTIAADN